MKRLKYMETHKKVKPHFSQGCDRLIDRIEQLLGNEEDPKDNID